MDSSRLRLAVTGAAPVPVSLVERMRDDLGFDTRLTAYGLTEATGVVSMCRPEDDPETISTTSGRAIPGGRGARRGRRRPGGAERGSPARSWSAGYNVMHGYFEDPEATAEAIDADGWLHTGDVGVMDDRGYLDITDRTKDMFICGGFNAYPAEIESILSEHPAVAQAAVVGVADERMGEVGFAWLVPAPGVEPPDEAAMIAWAREAMANFKAPRHVRWTEALPLNPSGKIQKFLLRDDAVAALDATPETTDDPDPARRRRHHRQLRRHERRPGDHPRHRRRHLRRPRLQQVLRWREDPRHGALVLLHRHAPNGTIHAYLAAIHRAGRRAALRRRPPHPAGGSRHGRRDAGGRAGPPGPRASSS